MGQKLEFIMGKLVIESLAKKAHVGRESLYKTLSGTGNPKWHTVVTLFVALGFNLRLT
jgi:probable addiction module antidote protein